MSVSNQPPGRQPSTVNSVLTPPPVEERASVLAPPTTHDLPSAEAAQAEPRLSSSDTPALNRTTTVRHPVKSRQDESRRLLKRCLNKLTEDSFPDVVEPMVAQLQRAQSPADVETFVDLIVEAAMSKVAKCELHADFLLVLMFRCPPIQIVSVDPCPGAMSSLDLQLEGDTAIHRAMRARLGKEFRNLPVNFDEPLETLSLLLTEEEALEKRRSRALGLFRLTGYLFIRRLVTFKFLKEIIINYTVESPQRPFEGTTPDLDYLTCVCNLLLTTGQYLIDTEEGPRFLDWMVSLLHEIRKQMLSSRTAFLVDEVLDGHSRNYNPKLKRAASDPTLINPGDEALGNLEKQIRKGRTLAHEGTRYANYMIVQEKGWRSGLLPGSWDRKTTISWLKPEARYNHFQVDDPPNAPSVDIVRWENTGESRAEPQSPAHYDLSPARRPQTPGHRCIDAFNELHDDEGSTSSMKDHENEESTEIERQRLRFLMPVHRQNVPSGAVSLSVDELNEHYEGSERQSPTNATEAFDGEINEE